MPQSTLTTSAAEIILREDGIAEFRALSHKKDEFSLEEVQKVVQLIDHFIDTHRNYLIEIKNGKFSHEARKFIASQVKIADKVAMVATGPIQKMLGNFFLGINKPNIETKLFNKRESAIEWLLQ